MYGTMIVTFQYLATVTMSHTDLTVNLSWFSFLDQMAAQSATGLELVFNHT